MSDEMDWVVEGYIRQRVPAADDELAEFGANVVFLPLPPNDPSLLPPFDPNPDPLVPGRYECRLCRNWIVLFPNSGRKRSCYHGKLHCARRHLQDPVFECASGNCHFRATTKMGILQHQKAQHANVGLSWNFYRLMSDAEEKRRLDGLLNECFPQVDFAEPPLLFPVGRRQH